jgi:integrase
MAAELVNENTPVNMISKQLGHSSIATTAVYLDHVNPQAVIDVMRSRSWSAEPEMKCIVTVQELVSAQV